MIVLCLHALACLSCLFCGIQIEVIPEVAVFIQVVGFIKARVPLRRGDDAAMVCERIDVCIPLSAHKKRLALAFVYAHANTGAFIYHAAVCHNAPHADEFESVL